MRLSLGFSPCPNDCFMFDAIVNRRIDLDGLEFAVHLDDVEGLNAAALAGQAQITKLSYHAYAYCTDRYVLLDAGSALGRNCGPLLISKRTISPEDVSAGALSIAIPGKYTTANFLMGLAGIVISRLLPDEVKARVNTVVRRSVEYGFANREASLPFVRQHAQEMSDEVMYKHIDLYVNQYSVDLGVEGRGAVELLFSRARASGVIPDVKARLFL